MIPNLRITITTPEYMANMCRPGELYGRKKVKKVNKIKLYFFVMWWLFKNRNWKDCRHKWKALDREIAKRGF